MMMMTTMILPKTKTTPIAVGEGEAEQRADSTMGAQILPEMERASERRQFGDRYARRRILFLRSINH